MTEYTRQIFVYGSNVQGKPGKGAALEAKQKHGAVYGRPSGLVGNSYGIVTKDLTKGVRSVALEYIAYQVKNLMQFAEMHPDWEFKVTPIGCGLAGFLTREIAPMFAGAPENMKLPAVFLLIINPNMP